MGRGIENGEIDLESKEPLFELGLIADAQYADIGIQKRLYVQDNRNTEGRCQRYREVPDKLRTALKALRVYTPPLTGVIHLGDIINGSNTPEETVSDLELIIRIFKEELTDSEGIREEGSLEAFHVIGNHCLEVGRSHLMHKLGFKSERGYYSRILPHKWKLIVLDTTEMSGHSGFPEDSWQCQEAREFQEKFGDQEQMSSWNGGITIEQMRWLSLELEIAERHGERVIVASHHQVSKGAARATHLAWNHEGIRRVLLDSPAFCIALAGHDHIGGYVASPCGRHFITLEALLEAPEDSNAFGILRVFDDRLEIIGRGTVTDRVMRI